MKIGYARVSTKEQIHDLQLDALREAGCKKIYTEVASGAKTDRPELAKCLADLRAGDVLVVWRLDRLGRNLKHLVSVVEELKEREVGFISVQDKHDTTTANGKLVFNIFASLAQFERDLISERTKAGLEAARSRGRKGGRPCELAEKQAETLVAMYQSGKHTMKDIAATFGISRPTAYDYVKKLTKQSA